MSEIRIGARRDRYLPKHKGRKIGPGSCGDGGEKRVIRGIEIWRDFTIGTMKITQPDLTKQIISLWEPGPSC